MYSNNLLLFLVILEVIIFLILMVVFKWVYNKLKKNTPRIFNIHEYFPEDEIHTLIQVFYLIMMGLFFVNILYGLIFVEKELVYFCIFDILLSLYLASELDKNTLKNKILVLLIIPFGSLTYLIFGNPLSGVLDFIHLPVFAYFIKVYYDKFREYTSANGLGIAILLLFVIIFFSFLFTQFTESVNPLDSLVMVSNAFTSNGYAVLGHSIPGKINSVVLVWSGYILSGVGTATLTAGILIRHFNSRFEELEELIKKNNEE